MLLSKGMEEMYRVGREWITVGLSNVMNRFNIGHLDLIKKLLYDLSSNTVSIIKGKMITHNICLDANSLYSSSFSSAHFRWNPYTGGVMYMAGPLKRTIKVKQEAMRIILEKKKLIMCKLKGHIPPTTYNTSIAGASSKYANVLNFPPIIRNINIIISKDTIGETTYNYMKENNNPVD
jgi:hypothetical protein